MKFQKPAGLVGAGGVNQSFLARLPSLLEQLGPVKGSSAELPLSTKLLGLCDHRNRTLWGRARRMDGIKTHSPLPPLGWTRLRPSTVRIENK